MEGMTESVDYSTRRYDLCFDGWQVWGLWYSYSTVGVEGILFSDGKANSNYEATMLIAIVLVPGDELRNIMALWKFSHETYRQQKQ